MSTLSNYPLDKLLRVKKVGRGKKQRCFRETRSRLNQERGERKGGPFVNETCCFSDGAPKNKDRREVSWEN